VDEVTARKLSSILEKITRSANAEPLYNADTGWWEIHVSDESGYICTITGVEGLEGL
jgi:hypothetical protein